MRRGFRPWQIIVIIIAIIAVVVALGIKFHWWTGGEKQDEKPVEEDLIVNLDDVSGYYPDISWEFMPTQMSKNDKARTKAAGFTDAVSFPFKSEDKDGKLMEVEEEILRSPIYADMVMRGLKDIKLSSGKTIGELNPWIGEFIKETDEAYALGTYVHPRGLEVWLTQDKDGKLYVTKEFRTYAVYTCVLLERLDNLGVKAWESEKNYMLPFVALNSSRRTELADYQEDKDALVLRYINKKGDVVFNIGFNVLDKRFEIVKPKAEETTTEKGSPDKTPATTTPTKPSNPEPAPTNPPETTSPPETEPTPETTTVPPKDTSKDPVNQGNAPRGGGSNKPDDGAGTYQPQQPSKSTTGPIYVEETTSEPVNVDTSAETTTSAPPPAEPAHVDHSAYTDTSGETVILDDDDVFDGEITIPD